MSNVHQLVKELATYEQQRKDLEHDLKILDDKFDLESEDVSDELYENLRIAYYNQVEPLEEQLDKVYKHIDRLEEEIEAVSNSSYGYDEEDY